MKGRAQERKQQGWHVTAYGGQWAVWDAQGKFRRTFAQREKAQEYADQQNNERNNRKR
jgi:hypothetical protein